VRWLRVNINLKNNKNYSKLPGMLARGEKKEVSSVLGKFKKKIQGQRFARMVSQQKQEIFSTFFQHLYHVFLHCKYVEKMLKKGCACLGLR